MSADAFKEFLFKMDGINNNAPRFKCIVAYESKHGFETDNTYGWMSVTTMEHGNISLVETKKITSDNYHLDFTPTYQNYSFKGKTLTIKGQSDKMGNYKVTITPTESY
ncbi:hypothetical protein [Thalassospira sp. CH_XMU1448-2]|uniref:hypothetical protein n=1 Tax=Thalassospira sp. CH_XMU1448-2 TaxID=3107773 RepID=UPI003008B419